MSFQAMLLCVVTLCSLEMVARLQLYVAWIDSLAQTCRVKHIGPLFKVKESKQILSVLYLYSNFTKEHALN